MKVAQIKNSFDRITKNKIIKGAFIASTGAGAIALLDYMGTLNIEEPILAAFIAWAIPVAVNAVKEYMAGE